MIDKLLEALGASRGIPDRAIPGGAGTDGRREGFPDRLLGDGWRLVARPGAVWVDSLGGTRPVELEWTQQDHDQAVAQAGRGGARVVAGAVVVFARPGPEGALTPWTHLDASAVRMLEQAILQHKNILVAGDWLQSVALCTALGYAGSRPCLVTSAPTVVPQGWLVTAQPEPWLGAAPWVVWDSAARHVHAFMRHHCGVVGWIEAHTLERALIRYEAAHDGDQGPLEVLAGLDVVVVVRPQGLQIAEIVLAEDGYRPVILTPGSQATPHPLAATRVATDSERDPSPGWEIDAQPCIPVAAEELTEEPEDHALMAATYGLAPPPPPPGFHTDFNRTFSEALADARRRSHNDPDE